MRASLLPIATALLLTAGAACAEDPAPTTPAAGPATGMGMGHRHRAGEEVGKSHRCMHKGMMGGAMMPRMLALPALPPGNARLEMQMQAEIMQKVGEIIARYAEQVKDAPSR